ncbi:MAG: hypothetical protein R2769_09650 [Saprospiraceae bacterium]
MVVPVGIPETNSIILPEGSYNLMIRKADGTCEMEYANNPVLIQEPQAPVISNLNKNRSYL